VYAWDGTSISTIVDLQTLPNPGSWWWLDYRFDGRNVVALVQSSPRDLLAFARPDGSRGVVVELDELCGLRVGWGGEAMGELAGGWLPLTLYDDFGRSSSEEYAARPDGSLVRILGPGDVLDGRTVTSVIRGHSDGPALVLAVSFSDPWSDGGGWAGDALYTVRFSSIVEIDVRPRHRANRIDPRRRSLVSVGLLGSEDLDVRDVDVASLAFGPAGASPWRVRVVARDVNRDGFVDLVARYQPRDTGIARGDDEACLSGETTDGVTFEGCDAVRTPAPPRTAR
jgi:hypothetical protein